MVVSVKRSSALFTSATVVACALAIARAERPLMRCLITSSSFISAAYHEAARGAQGRWQRRQGARPVCFLRRGAGTGDGNDACTPDTRTTVALRPANRQPIFFHGTSCTEMEIRHATTFNRAHPQIVTRLLDQMLSAATWSARKED